ncbi:MAG: hypothetical protein QM736_28845 [Vicinamibacterales bacterium]
MAVASDRGFEIGPGGLAALAAASGAPHVVVVDDPLEPEAARWVGRARSLGVPVATLHDLGLGCVASDLAIDGSIEQGDPRVALGGPMYAGTRPCHRRRARTAGRGTSRCVDCARRRRPRAPVGRDAGARDRRALFRHHRPHR